MNTAEAKRVLETALICATAPLPLPEMRALFDGEVGNDTLRRLLDELVDDWQDRGVELVALASGWRFQSRPELRPWLDRLHPEKPPKYSRAAMETLAIVAYRQPVTRPEIEEVRAVDCGAVLKALLERRLVKILGKKEEPGRPILYGTSREFLEFFALKDLASLPTLREFHELSEEHREVVEQQPEPSIPGLVESLADPTLRAGLEASQAESDAALDQLEKALETADTVTKAAEAALAKAPEGEPPDGERGTT
jgi:segregation and condensation protein B